MNPRIIAVTGGPCGGKSTIIPRIAEALGEAGYSAFEVPEVARAVLGRGYVVLPGDKGWQDFQRHITTEQLMVEDAWIRAATPYPKPVLILDRGAIDNKAYCKPGQWEAVLKHPNVDTTELRLQARYDGVLHLQTSSMAYQQDAIRKETVKEARELDSKIFEAWSSLGFNARPHHVVFDRANFEEKIKIAVESALNIVEKLS